MALPDPSLKWPIALAGVAMVADAEGCRLRAYRCPAGVPTIGWGATEGVALGMVWTQAQADQRLCDDLTATTFKVMAMLKEPADPNQLAALVSFAYNVGEGALAKSTVLKAHNARDYAAAARAFGLWNKATVGGVLTVLPGLTARRAAEAALYLKAEPDAPVASMPQAIAPESTMVASPIAQSGAATIGAGALVILGQAKETLGPVGESLKWAKGLLADLGLQTEWMLPAVLLGVGSVIVWQRLKQRSGGWA